MNLGLPKPPAWMEDAACIGQDPRVFFPNKGRSDLVTAAKAICAGCNVQAECYAYGLEQDYGIWAGMTDDERRVLQGKARRYTPRPRKSA